MNWADASTSTPLSSASPFFHIPRRHRPELLRPDEDPDSDDNGADHEPKSDMKMDESIGFGAGGVRYPDTHLGRLASIFSERMPCTGMYNGPSTSMPFVMHDMDHGSGSSSASNDLTMMTLDGAGPTTTTSGGNFMLQPTIDMPSFDEQTSVDLQQLFPSTSAHGTGLTSTSPSEPTGRSGYPTYASHTTSSLPSDHDLGGTAMDHFSEPYQSLPSHSSDHATGASHMMVPFPFGAVPSAFDEPDDLAPMPDASANAMEMQEVSNLFHNASLMTPPTAITIPRTTIVSPLNSFGPPRMMLPPGLRELGKSESLASAFEDEDNTKFSPDRRKLCCVDDCKSQARAFNRCKRHGGSKRCSAPNCTKSVQSRGLCIRHGGGSRCQEDNCTRAAQSHGKCKMHGGGRPCVVPGCEKKAHLKRLCRKHGGGAKCSLADCDKWAQRQGMCMTHSKHQLTMLASPPPSPASSATPPPAHAAAAMKRPVRSFFHHHDPAI